MASDFVTFKEAMRAKGSAWNRAIEEAEKRIVADVARKIQEESETMTKPEERTCDACGAAAMTRGGKPVHYDAWEPEFAHIGRVFLCQEHWRANEKELVPLILARRAAQPKEVDPRTLPVGAVFCWGWDAEHYTVTAVGKSCKDDRGVNWVISKSPAILISLPEAAQEVELGSLGIGDLFRQAKRPDACVLRVTHPVDPCGYVAAVIAYGDSAGQTSLWGKATRVLRVPAPSSAGSGKTIPPCESCGCGPVTDGLAANGDWLKLNDPLTRLRVCSTCAENPPPKAIDALQTLHDRIHAEDGPARPAKSVKVESRWPNTPESEWPRLDAILAAQVAAGGQNCLPARSLIERADRLRRENADRELGYIQEVKSRHTKVSGIASLRLERPLIAWKRRR